MIETGSFTQAAAALGYTQSSISQAIVSLEQEFQVQLLNRSRSGVSLTPAGAKLYPAFQRLLQTYNDTQVLANRINGLETGTVRIGATNSLSRYWLPDLIKGFETEHPHVHFTLYQGDFDEIRTDIRTGKVDYGFLKPSYTSGLTTKFLKNEQYVAIVERAHPLATKQTITLSELKAGSQNIILIPEGSHQEVLAAFAGAGVDPEIKDQIQDDYTVMAMVAAGLGVSVISKLMVDSDAFPIQPIALDPPIIHPIELAYRPHATLSLASQHFLQYMLAQRQQLR
ncbi:LysR family transcriptional regulator [Fructilactobacillus florum]|uniref:LysR family transcriptional regulator n=1 Tax=Fructilactobacillus florum TaxID=640331 RepID=UPI0034E25FDF